MTGIAENAVHPQQDFASCSGCGLCLLVCPIWRRDLDIGLTALGRAKALQHGAVATDVAASIQSCTLCAACEPVCPKEIALVAMTLALRRQLVLPGAVQSLRARMEERSTRPLAPLSSSPATLLPGQAMREHAITLARVAALLGGARDMPIADDDGRDIALALEAGVTIPTLRLERFLQPLRGMKKIVVADGLMLRHLRQWLPGSKIISLGEALSGLAAVRSALRASDLYVIEPRAYHADYQRLVKYYDALRSDAGCTFNLDLQRIAIPATARSPLQRLELESAVGTMDDSVQARWILQGRKITRIVVENMEDAAAFGQISDHPVVHLVNLVDDRPS